MKSWQVFNLILLSICLPMPGYSQGLAEFGATRSMPTGLGAGLGAGIAAAYGDHSKTIKNSYQTIINAKQAKIQQTKAIEQYTKYGIQLEAKKNWTNAEAAYRYVLQVISRRDGPGSIQSVPVLEHLVSVTKAQNKLADAIKYQQTVVAFSKVQQLLNPLDRINAECNLSNLYIQNSDFKSAASVLHDSVTYCKSQPSISAAARRSTFSRYAHVLRELHKDEEAAAIENIMDSEENTGASNKDAGVSKEANTSGPTMNIENDKDMGANKMNLEMPPPAELLPVSNEPSKAKQKIGL